MGEVRQLVVGEAEDGIRLDRWLRRRWPHLGQTQIHKLARSGQIRVDGARAKADTRLVAGAMVRVPPLPDAPPRAARNTPLSPTQNPKLWESRPCRALTKRSACTWKRGPKKSRRSRFNQPCPPSFSASA